MLRRLLVTCSLAALAAASVVHAADPSAIATARRDLAAAVSQGDAPGMMRARAEFAALAADGDSPELQWWIAYCGWRAVPLLTEPDREGARRLCKESIAACDRAVAANPRHADAIALKAALQALSLSFNPQAAMSLGPEMGEAYARAEAIEPANPRVQLFKGIHTLHMPEYVGGGPARARAVFARAVELADAAHEGAGLRALPALRADAHLWAGVCASRAGDWKSAAARYREALAVDPGNAWVTHRLLPEAQKHLAAADSTASTTPTPGVR
ncbi:MAG: hypothetical protein U0704_13585 [Candidatus Eisenbacteria bacterium]